MSGEVYTFHDERCEWVLGLPVKWSVDEDQCSVVCELW